MSELDIIQNGGLVAVIGILVYVIRIIQRGDWVRKGELDAALKREEEWKKLALRGTALAEKAVTGVKDEE